MSTDIDDATEPLNAKIEELREELAEMGSLTGLEDIPGRWSFDAEDCVWRVHHAGGSARIDCCSVRYRAASCSPERRAVAIADGAISAAGYLYHSNNLRDTCRRAADILTKYAATDPA